MQECDADSLVHNRTRAAVGSRTSLSCHTMLASQHQITALVPSLRNMARSTHLTIWMAAAAKMAVDLSTTSLVNQLVPNSYMDEPFHVQQTQQYCAGNFNAWDPKITTFPGLYLIGIAWFKLLQLLQGFGFQAVSAHTPDKQRLCPAFCAWHILVAAYRLSSTELWSTLGYWDCSLDSTQCSGTDYHVAAGSIGMLTSQVTDVSQYDYYDAANGGKNAMLYAAMHCLQKLEPCGTAALRCVNVLLAAACLPIMHSLVKQQQGVMQQPLRSAATQAARTKPHSYYQPAKPPQWSILHSAAPAWLWALVLSCMPLHWFYSFMYYTDVGSTLLLLLCYQQAQAGRYKASGLAGAGAVLFRQTNAVWVAFTFGASVLQLTRQATAQPGKPGTGSSSVNSEPVNLWQELQQSLSGVWQLKSVLAARLWPLLVVPAAFVMFLIHNKGVTVGDKEAHQPVVNPAQLTYFFLFSAAMLAPLLAGYLPSISQSALKHPMRAACSVAAAVACCYMAIRASPPPHPYLLADNRHYTFYVWRRLLARSPIQQLLLVAPAAGGAMALLLHATLHVQQRLWVLGYLVCLAAVLIPAWLLEFRYYTAGLLLLALHLPPPTTLQAFLMLVSYMLVNVGTMHLFLHKSWKWYDGSTARFMW